MPLCFSTPPALPCLALPCPPAPPPSRPTAVLQSLVTNHVLLAPPPQLAEHHYRLGEVYWRMRGRYRTEKQFAYTQVRGVGGRGGDAAATWFSLCRAQDATA